jgi:hypothetical protein
MSSGTWRWPVPESILFSSCFHESNSSRIYGSRTHQPAAIERQQHCDASDVWSGGRFTETPELSKPFRNRGILITGVSQRSNVARSFSRDDATLPAGK